MSSTTDDVQRSKPPARGLSAALDFAAISHRRAAALLVAVCLLAFLPGFFQIPPVDRDEARFAQATKQMVERGEYVDIRFQDEVRYKKPVGIYWLQAAAVHAGEALGVPHALTTIWLYRLPSLFGAIGAVLMTYWAALAFVGRRTALLAALMMASSILLGVEARLAKTDATLLFMSVTAMGAMARIYLSSRRTPERHIGIAMPALLWSALAGGVLIKGPLILMFVVLTALTLSIADRSLRWIRQLRPLTGLLWLLVLVSPWFIAIVAKSGDSFFVQALGHDMLDKITSGQEAHGAPPGFYLLLFWVTFWPGAVLGALATPTIWKARREPGARFLLAWLIPSWIVFEAVMTKLPHYVLPLYPAIAILIAGIVEGGGLSKKRWLVVGTAGWFIFPGRHRRRGAGSLFYIEQGSRSAGLAVRGGCGDFRTVCLVALRCRMVPNAHYCAAWRRRSSLPSPSTVSHSRCCRDYSRARWWRRKCAPPDAPSRNWHRLMPIRNRASSSCSAPTRVLPTVRALPNSCMAARAALRWSISAASAVSCNAPTPSDFVTR